MSNLPNLEELEEKSTVYDDDGVENTKLRQFGKVTGIVISLVAIAMSIFHVYTAIFGVFESILQRSAHLGFALVLVFAIYKPTKRVTKETGRVPFYDVIFIVLSIVCYSYFVTSASDISERLSYVTPLENYEVWIGLIGGLLLIEATRRVIGNALVIIIVTFLLYGFFGHLIPGTLGHREFSTMWIVDHLFYTVTGVFSTPLGVSSTFIFMFILFGKFLEVSGAGKFFIDLSVAGMGKYRGGPAKTAIVASSALGTISGSAVANTVTTGAFTIPLMKKTGYDKEFSGAVESVSSTGGQIMPPIMGASAFIIASYLGVPYMDIAIAAIIPALLYYVCLYVQVDLRAAKMGLIGLKKEELPNFMEVLKKGFLFFVPLIVIVYLLATGSSAMKAGLYAIVIVLIVGIINRFEKINFTKIIKALDLGARAAVETAIACAASGIIVGIISLTGIGLKFSSLILEISGGILLVTLILTMITSIILGMGLPTVAAYVVQVPLTIPALIELGVPALAAHLFVFYFAALSAITPPVALAAFAAAGISGADPMRTGVSALKLGLAAFIVPFFFVYGPQLIMIGSVGEIIVASITAVIGIIAIAMAVEGWVFRKCTWMERVFLIVGAFTLVMPGIVTDIIGVVVLALVIVMQKATSKQPISTVEENL
ncbi:TRAP transporter permease [Lysinibacillus sp. LZ02]|uniref:TRAP transporter permease n=1 Tax=Lysinibacillus sp. LZ02 TaxID=3420668 RepID=UPI003D36A831